jgi:hypothetical protein
MAREIPEVVRAAAGLAATLLDEARKLPETLPGLPVRVIGLAMQQAMKVQQQYAGLVARGDELFTGLRGEDEPGLATFDDDEPVPAPTGFRESAFDRAAVAPSASAGTGPITDEEADRLPADPPADAVTAVVDELAQQVEDGRQSIEELVEEAPALEEILDEIAIDELVDQAPTVDETAPASPALAVVHDVPATEDADALESALLESDDSPAATGEELTADVSTSVDVLTPDGEVAAVDAAVTDEGIAAPEAPADGADPGSTTATDEGGTAVAAATGVRTDVGAADTAEEDAAIAEGAAVDAVGAASAAPTDDPEGGSDVSGSQAAGTAPIEGYDAFSIAQLRGRMRGYALSTVVELIAYEEATRAREPYLRMLRNRLEKLEQQAVESSPLAPRGA